MSRSSLLRNGFLMLVLSISACRSDGLGPGGADKSCSTLDAASCAANSACEVLTCGGCDGTPTYAGCDANGVTHTFPCPELSCPAPCSDHANAADCNADSRCESVGCADCNGGQTFQGCYLKGTAPDIVCAADCPDCSTHQDESSCSNDSNCHAVFIDPQTCGCSSPGCCMAFNRCANGPARCAPDDSGGTCPPSAPFDCGGAYVTGYFGACPEGCVKQNACNDCRVTGCPTDQTCQACWTSYVCMDPNSVC